MAIDPVKLRFVVEGITDIDRAFASVIKRTEQMEAAGKTAAAEGSRARVRSAEQEVAARERAYAKLVKTVEREEAKRVSDSERAAQRIAREETRVREQALREYQRLEDYRMDVRRRSAEQAGRIAEQEAAAEARARRATGASMTRVAHRIGGSVGSLASIAGSTLSIGGGFALADIAGKQLAAERTAALLVNAGTTNGVAPGTVQQALAAASGASNASGMGKDEVLQGALRYAQSARGGDFKGALANMGFFAKMAKATNTDIGDIAEAAGVLQSQNAALGNDPKAMQRMLLNALAQSHAGSMSMVDAAKMVGTMGSTRSSFAGDETRTQQTLIGLGQIARVGGDVGEAGTFTKDLVLEVAEANKKWKRTHGANLVSTDAHGRISSPEEMIAQVFRGTHGNVEQINELFGRRGGTLFRELEKSYLQGEKTGGVEGGVRSALANVSQVTGATMTPEQLDKQLAVMLETPAEKLHRAWEKLVTTTGDKLEPELEKLADRAPQILDAFSGVIDAGGKLADFLLENPLMGLGTVLGAAAAKEMATAAIGEGVKKALEKSIVQSAMSGGFKIAVAGGAVALAAELVNMQVAKLEESQKAREEVGAQLGTNLDKASADLAAKVKSGKVTAADIANAQRLIKVSSQGIRQQIADTPGGVEIAGQVFGGFASGDFTGEGAKKAIADHAQTVKDNQAALMKLTGEALKAAEALAKLRTHAPTDPSRNLPMDARYGPRATE